LKELDERLDHEEAVDSPSSPETLSVWGLAWPSILVNIVLNELVVHKTKPSSSKTYNLKLKQAMK
jgi:hypothetical protein